MLISLKPCPFCKSENLEIKNIETCKYGIVNQISCKDCKSRGPESWDDLCADNWNERGLKEIQQLRDKNEQ